MAIIKAVKSGKSLSRAMDYVEKKAEIKSGKDCSDNSEKAKSDMNLTKDTYNKNGGRLYKHYIQSFKPGEVTPEKAHEIGKEWAEKNFKGFEVYVGTHIDREHIHNHFIINSVNFENGKKFHSSNKDLEHWKKVNDRICEREGLSVPDRDNKKIDEIRAYDMKKYKVFERIQLGEKMKSHVVETAKAVNQTSKISSNKTDFINKMNEKGYQVDWKDDHKHVCFKNEEGKKVRLSNLEKTFNNNKFSKEGLENEFQRFRGKDGSKTNSHGEDARADLIRENGIGKPNFEREFTGVQSTIRDIEERARQFSPTNNERANDAERKNPIIEKQQRDIKPKHKGRTRQMER